MSLIAELVESQDHIGNEIMSKEISNSYIGHNFMSKEFAAHRDMQENAVFMSRRLLRFARNDLFSIIMHYILKPTTLT